MPLQKFITEFSDLAYPRLCAACGKVLLKEEDLICIQCLSTLPRTNFHEMPDNPIEKTFWGRIMLEKATAYFYFTKNGRVQNLLHNIKYNGLKELAVSIGLLFATEVNANGFFSEIDIIIPVPLHPKKLKARGYNQSEYFALGMAEALKKPLSVNNLVRVRYSDTQTRKSRYERWENVGNIFSVNDLKEYEGKHLLLVDDVITTGATLEACYLALKNIQGMKLSLASIAYASH